jgi:CubicO group peptidase (beta-lactamase class C family)
LPTGRRLAYRRKYIEAGRAALLKNGAFDPLAWPFVVLLAHPDIEDPLELATIASQPWFAGAELPAANGIGTARALAKMYAVLSLGGEMDGVRLVSEDAIRRFSTVAETSKTTGLGFFVPPPSMQAFGTGKGAFGSGGAGGTIALADPTNRLSIAFTKNQMRDQSMAGARLILALYRSLGGASGRTRIRQSALGAVFNHRRVTTAGVAGIGWLQSFRSVEKANPFNRD